MLVRTPSVVGEDLYICANVGADTLLESADSSAMGAGGGSFGLGQRAQFRLLLVGQTDTLERADSHTMGAGGGRSCCGHAKERLYQPTGCPMGRWCVSV